MSPRRRGAASAGWRAHGQCRHAASGRRRVPPDNDWPCRKARRDRAAAQRGFRSPFAHAGDFERQRHIVESGTRRQKVEVLEDHADGTAQRAQALFIERRDIDAINDHTAGRGLLKAVGEADQRGLARTRAADDAGDGAFRHDVIDTGKGCEAGLAVGAAKRSWSRLQT